MFIRWVAAAGVVLLMAGCSPQVDAGAPKVVEVSAFATPESETPPVNSIDEQLMESKQQAATIARNAAADQPIVESLAGPAVLMSLGQTLTEVRPGPDGVLPDASFNWAGCPQGCAPLTTREIFATVAGDLVSSSTQTSSTRVVGPGAAASDPRSDSLAQLPTVVSYREDTATNRWRTWYVIFGPEGGLIAVLGESGALR